MTERTALIEAVIDAPHERRAAILAAAHGTDRPRPGTIGQAAEILGAHPRTVQRYEQAGLLHAIRITPRRVRYDLNEVEQLATTGESLPRKSRQGKAGKK